MTTYYIEVEHWHGHEVVTDPGYADGPIELTADEYAEYQTTMKAFFAWQDRLRAAVAAERERQAGQIPVRHVQL